MSYSSTIGANCRPCNCQSKILTAWFCLNYSTAVIKYPNKRCQANFNGKMHDLYKNVYETSNSRLLYQQILKFWYMYITAGSWAHKLLRLVSAAIM